MANRRREAVPPATDTRLSAGGIFTAERYVRIEPIALAPGSLTIVSLPLGNPEDISIRALRVLMSVSTIAAENPPRTRALMQRYGIVAPVRGYRERDDESSPESLIQALRSGATAALVCDAGTPLIADAGAQVVRAALVAGVRLTVVPGPVAAIAALVLAGGTDHRFLFDGFPPRARAQREAYFPALAREQRTILLYETRRFLPDTLRRLRIALGPDRKVAIARDLTKPGEALFHGGLAEAEDRFRNPPPGEYTLVILR
jgi:16S rRNA (cytidine1402-2'-O)-methyltransferase